MPTARSTAQTIAAVQAAPHNVTHYELVAAYLDNAREDSLGVNYFLAQEMERRGFRSKRTAGLTRKATRFLPGHSTASDTRTPHEHTTAVPADRIAGLTDEEFEKLAEAVRTEGKRRRAARRRSS